MIYYIFSLRAWLSLGCFLLILSASLPSSAGDAPDRHLISIGRPTSEVSTEYERLRPIAAYLAARMAGEYPELGISEGRVVLEGKNSLQSTMTLMEQGAIDLLFETPSSSLAVIRDGGAVPILLIEREGVVLYNSYVFVRSDSGLESIEQLEGKVIAFEDPGSTSAFHLPRKMLENEGLRLEPVATPEADVPQGVVGYVFAGSELNVSSWVYFGRTTAGALSNLDWASQDENPEAFRQEFTILKETGLVPRMLVLARPGLAPEVVDAVTSVLLSMHADEQGRVALEPYDINRFHIIDDPRRFIEDMQNLMPDGNTGGS